MNEVVHTSPTIGSNVEEVRLITATCLIDSYFFTNLFLVLFLQIVWKNMHFLMWDIGGQDSLRASWDTYYANTEVSIIVLHDVYTVLIIYQIR